MADMRCSSCGTTGLEPGFVMDDGEHAKGFARWVQGELRRGPLGGARLMGRPKWQIDAFRCPQCHHLELFAEKPA